MSRYENHMVEDAIELHTDAGVKLVGIPGEFAIARAGAMIMQIMDAAGYESIKPTHGAVFAFAPKVEADEVTETPFDWPHTTLGERITMTPGTRAYEIEGHATGYRWKFRDYATGRIYHARADEAQPDLRPVRSE